MTDQSTPSPNKTSLNLVLDYRLITVVLLAVIVAMLLVWKPWSGAAGTERTVKVTGQATITAEPDEYVFYPTYQFKNASKETALAELTKKSDELVSKLKALGVADNKLKTNASGQNGYDYIYNEDRSLTYTLQLTVTAGDKALAQKVQDYLMSTSPTGSVSPQPGFSNTMRKVLESKARDEATQDARAKADQSAKNLGFKVAKVKTVEDGSGFGDIYPVSSMAQDSAGGSLEVQPKLAIQPGENDIVYSVSVIYFVR